MVNLILADDHVVLRQALCEMLESRSDYKVIAQAADGEELLSLLDSHAPDIIIMDLAMPKLGGIQALERLGTKQNKTPVLILSACDGETNVRSALKAGAKGFVPKNVGTDELVFAINSILKGKTYLSPTVTDHLMTKDSAEIDLNNPLKVLTKREVQILKHLADGKKNKEIGELLHISVRTVDTHRSNILRKLNAKTNADLVKLAIRHGVIEVSRAN